MKKAVLFLFASVIVATASAQAPVSTPAPPRPDTLETLEQSDAYKKHQADADAMKADAQKQLDSLFSDHEHIVGTTRASALKDWEAEKAENAQTLKALREEEIELRKELRKEQEKTNGGLKSKVRKSFNKTKYEKEEDTE